jgi:hypothetical protein
VPIGEVDTSQFNRAYETAVLAGFKDIETTAGLSEGGLVVTPDGNSRRANALRDMLAKAPDKGNSPRAVKVRGGKRGPSAYPCAEPPNWANPAPPRISWDQGRH